MHWETGVYEEHGRFGSPTGIRDTAATGSGNCDDRMDIELEPPASSSDSLDRSKDGSNFQSRRRRIRRPFQAAAHGPADETPSRTVEAPATPQLEFPLSRDVAERRREKVGNGPLAEQPPCRQSAFLQKYLRPLSIREPGFFHEYRVGVEQVFLEGFPSVPISVQNASGFLLDGR